MEGFKPTELRTRLSFSRPDFTRDVLFSKDGFKLKPRVFTESTKRLPDDEKIPSTSAKDHLPYFEHVPFVNKLMAYQRLSKLRNTYVGHPETDTEAATGFWQYIFGDKIHPSFLLHATVTGRTSSRDLIIDPQKSLAQIHNNGLEISSRNVRDHIFNWAGFAVR